MNIELGGRIAIVTGASRGIGRACALALAEEGAVVIAVARSGDALARLGSETSGDIYPVPCDLADLSGVEQLPNIAVDRFGALDIVVNNAGIAPAAPFAETDLFMWEQVLRINVLAPAALMRAAGRFLVRQGSGKVINVSSISGVRGKSLLSAYSASKGALLRLTESVAAEWARCGVQVNAIAPGAFNTDAQSAVLKDHGMLRRRLQRIPARRLGEPDEVGPLVCYLASSAADFVTGATFVIDGGEVGKL